MKNTKIDFNVNDYIYAKLTEEGRRVLRERHNTLNQMIQEKGGRGLPAFQMDLDKDGFSKFQMWDFMQIFGPFSGMCSPLMFNTDIKFEVKK